MIERINEIRNVISEGNLTKAFYLLKEYFGNTDYSGDIINLSSRYNQMEEQKVKDLLSHTEENLTRNKLIESSVALLTKIKNHYEDRIEQIPEWKRRESISNAITRIKQKVDESKDDLVTILVVGKSGVGKSSIINTLLGREIAKVGRFKPTTFEVEMYENQINNIKIRIYDTPGLCDKLDEYSNDADYIEKIKRNISENQIDCVLYAAELKDSRFDLGDQKAIKIITQSLGNDIWKNGIIVLTKADEASSEDFFDCLINRKMIIQEEIDTWSSGNYGKNIPVVATSTEVEKLPNGKIWLNDLFTTIFTKMSEKGFAPFLHRFLQSDDEVTGLIVLEDSDKEKITDRLVVEAKKEKSLGELMADMMEARIRMEMFNRFFGGGGGYNPGGW